MNARQAIVSDDDVRDILKKLLDGPKRILAQQEAFEQAQYEVEVFPDYKMAQERVANIEAEQSYLIRAEKNGDGKAKYTNEEQRTAALRMSLSKDPEYLAAVKEMGNAQVALSNLKLRVAKLFNQVNYAKNDFRANETAMNLVAGLAVENIEGQALVRLAHIKAELSTMITKLEGGNGNGQ